MGSEPPHADIMREFHNQSQQQSRSALPRDLGQLTGFINNLQQQVRVKVWRRQCVAY